MSTSKSRFPALQKIKCTKYVPQKVSHKIVWERWSFDHTLSKIFTLSTEARKSFEADMTVVLRNFIA